MTEPFLQIYTRSHRRIYGFILTLLPDRDQADDVMQETGLALWRQFATFRPEADFVRWACGIAYNQVRNHLRIRQRQGLRFDEELVARIADFRSRHDEVLQARRLQLRECVKRLPQQDRDLIAHYTFGPKTIRCLAADLGRPTNTVYKAFKRIRLWLAECIDRSLGVQSA